MFLLDFLFICLFLMESHISHAGLELTVIAEKDPELLILLFPSPSAKITGMSQLL